MFFSSLFRINVEKAGSEKVSLPDSKYYPEPFSHAAIHVNCTCSLVVELLNGAK